MPLRATVVGDFFPVVEDKSKKIVVCCLNNQWLVMRRRPNVRQYQVVAIFLREKDAKVFKKQLKKSKQKWV